MSEVNSRHEALRAIQNGFGSKLRIDLFMKKLIVAIVCVLAATGTIFAQGVLLWNAFGPSFIAQTNTTLICPLFFDGGLVTGSGTIGNTSGGTGGNGNYYYELLYNTSFTGSQAAAPNAAALFGGTWLDTGLTATNVPNGNGRINAVNPQDAATVPWAQGTTNNIMLVGWSVNLGTSWLAASNVLANWDTFGSGTVSSEAFFGESAMGYLTPNTSPPPGAVVFGSVSDANGLLINNIASPMQLYIIGVPESGTIALLGLGGLSLLFCRRK